MDHLMFDQLALDMKNLRSIREHHRYPPIDPVSILLHVHN